MTKIGNSIITEFVSEINEKIEDDKILINVSQALSFIFSIWNLVSLTMNLFIYGFVVLLLIALSFIDSVTLDLLRSATNDEIISGIKVFLSATSVVAVISLVLLVAFTSHRYFRNKRRERIEKEQKRENLIKTIIEINEELLLRHKLITREEI